MSIMYMKNGALRTRWRSTISLRSEKNVNNRFIAAFEEEFDDKMVGAHPILK